MTPSSSSQPSDRVDLVELELRLLAGQLVAPLTGECLYCYLVRMLDEFGCHNDHRFTQNWAVGRRVRGRPVLDWAHGSGGYCDCEVIVNSLGRPATRRVGLLCATARRAFDTRDAAS